MFYNARWYDDQISAKEKGRSHKIAFKMQLLQIHSVKPIIDFAKHKLEAVNL
jgi:hypothetical protein